MRSDNQRSFSYKSQQADSSWHAVGSHTRGG